MSVAADPLHVVLQRGWLNVFAPVAQEPSGEEELDGWVRVIRCGKIQDRSCMAVLLPLD